MVHVLRDDFEFVLAILHWSQSSTTLLMIVPFLACCPYSCFIGDDCVQLLLALVSCFEPVIRAKLLEEKKTTYVQIHEAQK